MERRWVQGPSGKIVVGTPTHIGKGNFGQNQPNPSTLPSRLADCCSMPGGTGRVLEYASQPDRCIGDDNQKSSFNMHMTAYC